MNRILKPVRRFTAELLDDVCVFGESGNELFIRTSTVLKILHDNGLILQLRKRSWFQTLVRSLKLIIDKSSLHTDSDKVSDNGHSVTSFDTCSNLFSPVYQEFLSTRVAIVSVYQRFSNTGNSNIAERRP